MGILRQLRIAETEKYVHVTYFLNGGNENLFNGEDRILIPSPKVATYDLQPEMSAHEVTENCLNAINSDKYEAIIINYANPDMVGHTGNLEATIKACEVVDRRRGVLVMSCDADFGASGAPVFSLASGEPQIVSLISAKAESNGTPVSLGTSLAEPLAVLMVELKAQSLFRQASDRTRPGGAKFIRP